MHLIPSPSKEYQDDMTEDILSVASAKQKREQLREIEEALSAELRKVGHDVRHARHGETSRNIV